MFGGGGFAGDQFAGGGFAPSQAPQNDGYGAGSGGGRGSNKQTLRTLNIRQLVKATSRDDDMFVADGQELSNVTVLGKITNVREAAQSIILTITDGTGNMEVEHWLTDDPAVSDQKRAEWVPGVYVRAYGHLRRQPGQGICLNGFNVRTVTDFNEVTYHGLKCIFEHLHLTKGNAGQGVNAPSGMGAPAAAMPTWQGGGVQQATAYAGAGANMGGGASTAVMQIIMACNSENGLHRNEVYSKLRGQYGQADIDNALISLTNEAHVYTTCDDDHFRAA